MRVYHFVNRQFGLEDLARRRLKIATINDLNDPFELLGPDSGDVAIRRRFQWIKDQLAASRGILCFSRNWKNPVQWSHYADKHRGLGLGFDVPDACLTRVQYRPKRLQPSIAALNASEDLAGPEMLKVLSTKYSHWRYENEMRCFLALDEKDEEKGMFFASFSDALALKEVIVGPISTVSRAELLTALGDLSPKVSMLKARLAFRSFTVVRQRDGKLWT